MPIEGGSSTRKGVELCFLKFFVPETLKKLSQVFGLGMRKHFELETEVIVFIRTLLSNKQNKLTK